jgi:hypothetical protein
MSKSDVTGEVSYKKVVNTFIRQTDEIYNVKFENASILETTWNHPFRRFKSVLPGDAFSIENSEWTEARDLKKGDQVYSADGSPLVVESVIIEQREETVYNFEVEDFHTYFVGEDGVWVHNVDCLKTTHEVLNSLGNSHLSAYNESNDPLIKLYHSLGIFTYGTADLILPPNDVEAGKDILTMGPIARPLALATGFGSFLIKSKLGKKVGAEKGTKAITSKLQSYVNQAVKKVDDLGDEAFTPKQLRAMQRNPNLTPMFRGNRIDVKTRELMKNDPLGLKLKSNYTNGPDFVDPTTGRWWDMTTPKSWSAHEKKYGAGGTFLNAQ